VAKPNTRIADETEKHVKDSYEKMPITRKYFKKRNTAVTCPVGLVPRLIPASGTHSRIEMCLLQGFDEAACQFWALPSHKTIEPPAETNVRCQHALQRRVPPRESERDRKLD
jgi:hypothetical protein